MQGLLSRLKREGNSDKQMKLKDIMFSEISQSQKDKYSMS